MKGFIFKLLFLFCIIGRCSAQGLDTDPYVDSTGSQMKIYFFWFYGQTSKLTKKEYKVQNDTMFLDLFWWDGKNGVLSGVTADTIVEMSKTDYYNLCAIKMTSWLDYNLVDTSYYSYNDTLYAWFQLIYPTNNCSPLAVSNNETGSYGAYPNPCHNDLYVKEQPISITNMQGSSMRILYTNGVLDTRAYPQGIYFIRTKKGVLQILKE